MLLSNITVTKAFLLLNIPRVAHRVLTMKQLCLIAVLLAGLAVPAPSMAADCYADYKAKRDNPLRLHYGVAEISKCSKKAAKSELSSRLSAQGWTLLNVMSVFDKSGLAERKQSAGSNYLRY